MAEFGGVTMQATRLTQGTERMHELVQIILAIVVFSLVIGIWVCLWVPAAPVL